MDAPGAGAVWAGRSLHERRSSTASGWLFDPDNWRGSNGIGHARRAARLVLGSSPRWPPSSSPCPIGLAIGHTGRGRFVAANVAGIWRAIPTIGVVTIVFRWQPLSVWPVLVALVVLAIPPIVLNTVAGIDSVPADVRDAARGMGLTGWQSLWQVEVPNALPLILAGVRSAANQVIATATVAGFVGLGTLGVFIYTASQTQQYDVDGRRVDRRHRPRARSSRRCSPCSSASSCRRACGLGRRVGCGARPPCPPPCRCTSDGVR